MDQTRKFIMSLIGLLKNIGGCVWITNCLGIFYYLKYKMYTKLGGYFTPKFQNGMGL